MEILSKLFDITKLPSKFFAWAAMLSGLIAFLPTTAMNALHLQEIPSEYRAYAGVTFVGASAFLAINLALYLWGRLLCMFERLGARRLVRRALADLDFAQIAVLREFFIQGQHVIELPIDHPTVVGLICRGVLQRASNAGYQDIAGRVFPVQLSAEAKEQMTRALLGLPANPTEEDIQRVHGERPGFMRQIAWTDLQRGGWHR